MGKFLQIIVPGIKRNIGRTRHGLDLPVDSVYVMSHQWNWLLVDLDIFDICLLFRILRFTPQVTKDLTWYCQNVEKAGNRPSKSGSSYTEITNLLLFTPTFIHQIICIQNFGIFPQSTLAVHAQTSVYFYLLNLGSESPEFTKNRSLSHGLKTKTFTQGRTSLPFGGDCKIWNCVWYCY